MKGKISVEHILPQSWDLEWIENSPQYNRKLSVEETETWRKDVGSFINGIGNLLLLNPSANTSLSNNHPAEKDFTRYCVGGSYAGHSNNISTWRDPDQWRTLIHERGEDIFRFILESLVEYPESLAPVAMVQNPADGADAGAADKVIQALP
jgi:hypothetical protein